MTIRRCWASGQPVRVALDDGDPRQESRAEELSGLGARPGRRPCSSGSSALTPDSGSVEIPGSECQAKNAATATGRDDEPAERDDEPGVEARHAAFSRGSR